MKKNSHLYKNNIKVSKDEIIMSVYPFEKLGKYSFMKIFHVVIN